MSIGPVPVHEAVQSASGFDHRFSRLEMQVIGVGQHHLSARGCELIRGHAFTVARVPTGMKRGVVTVPWGVVKLPQRAAVRWH